MKIAAVCLLSVFALARDCGDDNTNNGAGTPPAALDEFQQGEGLAPYHCVKQ